MVFSLFYSEKEGRNLRQIILNGNYVFNDNKFSKVSPWARDLIRQMLVVSPQRRITIDNILKHPWIAKVIFYRFFFVAKYILKNCRIKR